MILMTSIVARSVSVWWYSTYYFSGIRNNNREAITANTKSTRTIRPMVVGRMNEGKKIVTVCLIW